MNFKELVSKVSIETSLPAAEVRKVSNAVLKLLRENVLDSEDFSSPGLVIRAVTIQSKEKINDQGLKTFIPERKIGRLIPREPTPRVD